MVGMKLASKKPLKCYKKEEDILVNNDNVIMLYNVDLDGKVYFELAEILDKKTGQYKMLKTGELRQYLPFVGHKDDKDYEYEETFYEYGEEVITQHGINYEIIDRQDNIAFVKLHHMYLDRISHMYSLKEYFSKLTCNYGDTKVYYANDITFGKDSNKRYSFSAFIFDEKGLFRNAKNPLSDWLEFENDINNIYNRYKSVGKNYVERDDKIIEHQQEVYKKEVQQMVDRVHKDMERQLGQPLEFVDEK